MLISHSTCVTPPPPSPLTPTSSVVFVFTHTSSTLSLPYMTTTGLGGQRGEGEPRKVGNLISKVILHTEIIYRANATQFYTSQGRSRTYTDDKTFYSNNIYNYIIWLHFPLTWSRESQYHNFLWSDQIIYMWYGNLTQTKVNTMENTTCPEYIFDTALPNTVTLVGVSLYSHAWEMKIAVWLHWPRGGIERHS